MMSRAARSGALWVGLAVLVTAAAFGLPRSSPPYAAVNEGTTEARVRLSDHRVLRHEEALWGNDGTSYYARARSPLDTSYLANRGPYVYRFAYPWLAWGLHKTTGLSVIHSMTILTAIALGAIAAATSTLARSLGARVYRAIASGLVAAAVPSVLKLIGAPATTDAFGAAAAAVALLAAIKRRTGPAAAMLVLAIWVRETNALFAMPIAALAWQRGSLRVAGSVLGLAAIAALAPRVMFEASSDLEVLWQMRQGLAAKGDWRAVVDYIPAGFGLMAPLAVATLFHRGTSPFVAAMIATMAGFALLGFFSADAGRLVGTSSFLIAAVAATSSVSDRTFYLLAGLSITSGLLWVYGEGATIPLIFGLGGATLVSLRIARQATPPQLLQPQGAR